MSDDAKAPTGGRVKTIDGYVGDLGGKITPEVAEAVSQREYQKSHSIVQKQAVIKEANNTCVLDGEEIIVTLYGREEIIIMSLDGEEYWWLDSDHYPDVVSEIVNNTQSILVEYSDYVIDRI